MRAIISILITALSFWVAIWILPGMELVGTTSDFGQFMTLVLISVIFGLLNETVGAFLRIISLPVTCLTLGLFTFILNAALLELTAWVTGLFPVSLEIDAFFWTAIFGAIIISIVSSLVHWLFNKINPPATAAR